MYDIATFIDPLPSYVGKRDDYLMMALDFPQGQPFSSDDVIPYRVGGREYMIHIAHTHFDSHCPCGPPKLSLRSANTPRGRRRQGPAALHAIRRPRRLTEGGLSHASCPTFAATLTWQPHQMWDWQGSVGVCGRGLRGGSNVPMASMGDDQHRAADWLSSIRCRLQVMVDALRSQLGARFEVGGGAASSDPPFQEGMSNMLRVIRELEEGPPFQWDGLIDSQQDETLKRCCYDIFEVGQDVYAALEEEWYLYLETEEGHDTDAGIISCEHVNNG
ncbi:hypothetical protein CBR_g15969 [Chara braunii]|uniref:Uncharacterized protein n=1 Tax=Chara braunii TaxID=69332 RepID=A0A388JSW1_CHABU|nr:hypothetical protein CBR_g15969 [Chara braunii]|eukprot:GBG60847.1 hypothetical protein CBR_g15969 [Chara braunii]